MTVYKLTTPEGTTHNGYKWSLPSGGAPGGWHETDGAGGLCGPGWLHWYHHPLLAALMNPAHADIADPVLWEAEAGGELRDDHGLKGGSTRLRLVARAELPALTAEQRTAIAIAAALEVHTGAEFGEWAAGWLQGGEERQQARARARALGRSLLGLDCTNMSNTSAACAAYAAYAAGGGAITAGNAVAWAARSMAQSTHAVPEGELGILALAERALSLT